MKGSTSGSVTSGIGRQSRRSSNFLAANDRSKWTAGVPINISTLFWRTMHMLKVSYWCNDWAWVEYTKKNQDLYMMRDVYLSAIRCQHRGCSSIEYPGHISWRWVDACPIMISVYAGDGWLKLTMNTNSLCCWWIKIHASMRFVDLYSLFNSCSNFFIPVSLLVVSCLCRILSDVIYCHCC